MKLIADLHIHSRHSRATSGELTLHNLEKYARIKGLGILGTGDFLHPKWRQEISRELKEDENGILWSSSGFPFLWQTEISLAYSQGGRGRRVHFVILAPNKDVVDQVTGFFLSKGRIDYDGRPIFGFSSIELVESLMAISRDIEIIPAHAWTPWFSVFGSMSGFDSLKECFGDKVGFIHAIETGLSSDPPMNWRVKELDDIALLSNSDCHSFWPWRLGREANIFEINDVSYKGIIKAIRNREISATVEVDPGYGKYHYDGHRNCGISLPPFETNKVNNICPRCRKPLTIGVLNRVEQLANRPEGYKPENAAAFYSLIPLSEIIALVNGNGVSSVKTWKMFYDLIKKFGTEFKVLLEAPEADMEVVAGEKLAEAIITNREGRIEVIPGYDGEYGKPVLGYKPELRKDCSYGQKGLGDFF
ncbi:DNA helicase UvrD [Candidatus Woesearchaeota archaeon]|nr:DNA helicase UvrD [Candidatus Woesearchaeota archaeon]